MFIIKAIRDINDDHGHVRVYGDFDDEDDYIFVLGDFNAGPGHQVLLNLLGALLVLKGTYILFQFSMC